MILSFRQIYFLITPSNPQSSILTQLFSTNLPKPQTNHPTQIPNLNLQNLTKQTSPCHEAWEGGHSGWSGHTVPYHATQASNHASIPTPAALSLKPLALNSHEKTAKIETASTPKRPNTPRAEPTTKQLNKKKLHLTHQRQVLKNRKLRPGKEMRYLFYSNYFLSSLKSQFESQVQFLIYYFDSSLSTKTIRISRENPTSGFWFRLGDMIDS